MRICRKTKCQVGEMAQWLQTLSTFPEVLSSIPSNHMVAHNNLCCRIFDHTMNLEIVLFSVFSYGVAQP